MVLPVTEAFYNRARSGTCRSMDCQPEDLLEASDFLITEAFAPRADLREKKLRPGVSFVMAFLCQHALLSDVEEICTLRRPLHLLSYAATPVGTRRLKTYGYRPIGTCVPGTNIEYMERELVLSARHPADAPLVGIWITLQELMRQRFKESLPPVRGASPGLEPVTRCTQPPHSVRH